MINKNKFLGGSVIALAVVLGAGASLADRAADHGKGFGGPMGPGAQMPFDFTAADADKDGKLTQAELNAYRTAWVKDVDSNGDGLISADELSAMHLKAAQARIEAQSKEMIANRDMDGDGKLSVVELLTPPLPAKLFERLDTDKDGAISQAELDAMKARGLEKGHKKHMHGDKHGEGKDRSDRGQRSPQHGPEHGQPPAPPAPPAAPVAPQN